MATNGTRKVRTAADIAAAVKLGAIDPSTPMATAEEAAEAAVAAAQIPTAVIPTGTDSRSNREPTDHECAIPGCRHGAAHHGAPQPDRQIKLQCPTCGAVARMTGKAANLSLGITCIRDGVAFAVATRRTYNRKGGAA